MNYIKARTETGVKFEGPLKTKGDYRRAIRFLEQELSIFGQVKKPVQKTETRDTSAMEVITDE